MKRRKILFLFVCGVYFRCSKRVLFLNALSPKITILTLEESCGPKSLRAKTFTYCSSRNPFSFVYCVAPFVSFRFRTLIWWKRWFLGNGTPFKLFEVILELFE